MIEILNMDCMDYLKSCKDNEFDLAIVDPPYGINAGNQSDKSKMAKQKDGSKKYVQSKIHEKKDWDKNTPPAEYFSELKRVSKDQIIWGVNYYSSESFGVGRIVWDKLNDHSDQNDCEIAFNSTDNRTEIVRYLWSGFMQGMTPAKDCRTALEQIGNKKKNEQKIHPTQKPVKLYEWILNKYTKPKMRILDTHLGSGSSAIAAHYFGCDFVGIELDKDYYLAAKARIEQQTAQIDMF